MFIKHLIGSRKGEIEDVAYEAARAKVIAGEAEDVYQQLPLSEAPQSEALASVPQPEVVSTRADSVHVTASGSISESAKNAIASAMRKSKRHGR